MQIMEAFLVRTDPDSSMVKPAHIHITRAPQSMNEMVLNTNWSGASTAMLSCSARAKAVPAPQTTAASTASSFTAEIPRSLCEERWLKNARIE